MPVFLSRFAKTFEKDSTVAYYHSLRMKPVYVDLRLHGILQQDIIGSGDINAAILALPEADREIVQAVLPYLFDYKIFNTDPGYDDAVLARLRDRMSPPYVQIAYFVLTELCNLSCSYCFIENKMDNARQREKVMPKSTAQKALDFFCMLVAKDHRQFDHEKNIIIYGGEPLTNYGTLQYLLGLITEYKRTGQLPENTNVSIITNGTLLTPEIAQHLHANSVSIAVSLDGSSKCANSCRVFHNGAEAYEQILKGVEAAVGAGCDCGLSVTLTEETIKEFDEVKRLVQAHGISSLGFNILMTDDQFEVSSDYNHKAADFILRAFEYFREHGIYEDRVMRKVKAFVDAQIYMYDCGALGGNQIVVAPDGQVGICHGYLHDRSYFPTDVYDEEFEPAANEVYIEWARRTPLNMPGCLDCEALGICGGGCPLNAANNGPNRSIWDVDERFCVHAKKTLEWLVWDLHRRTVE